MGGTGGTHSDCGGPGHPRPGRVGAAAQRHRHRRGQRRAVRRAEPGSEAALAAGSHVVPGLLERLPRLSPNARGVRRRGNGSGRIGPQLHATVRLHTRVGSGNRADVAGTPGRTRTTMSERIFEGRTAVVTGGSRGIGKAIACRLARDGARVAINFERNATAARETLNLIEQAGGQGIVVQADIASPPDVDRLMATVRAQWGPIEFLVNNAGIAETISHGELTFARWKRMLDVNLDGTFLTTWAVKEEMLARRFGRIVNVSSLAGLVKKKDMIHYATA